MVPTLQSPEPTLPPVRGGLVGNRPPEAAGELVSRQVVGQTMNRNSQKNRDGMESLA